MTDPNDKPKPPARPGRRLVTLATTLGACAFAAGALVPAIAFVAAPVRRGGRSGGGRWVRTVRLDQLRDGDAKRIAIVDDRRDAWTLEKNVELGSVWLVRRGGEVIAFSAVCPHLGCSVNAEANGFACPCHTSAFDAAGKRTSGPSPRDLDALATRIEDGVVVVDFKRFRIGVPEKVET